MELNEETEKGFWANDINSGDRIFIYNEALVEKLCILGQNVEPCFEGSQIKDKFSLTTADFETRLFSLIGELKEAIQGGLKNPMEDVKEIVSPEVEETPAPEYVKQEEKEEEKKETTSSETQEEQEEENKAEEKDDKKKDKYNLEEVVEYQELKSQYNELNSKYEALEAEHNELKNKYSLLETENTELSNYKMVSEKKEKEALVDSFYMLSDEDKKDVVEHLNEYSLEDIKAKLAIICFEKKVSYIKEDEEGHETTPASTFSLEAAAAISAESDNAPEWIKAVRKNQNN